MLVPVDDDLYKQLDQISEQLGLTTEYVVELAIEHLIKSSKIK